MIKRHPEWGGMSDKQIAGQWWHQQATENGWKIGQDGTFFKNVPHPGAVAKMLIAPDGFPKVGLVHGHGDHISEVPLTHKVIWKP